MLGPTTPIPAKVVPSAERSTSKPSSLLELSFQVRLISDVERAVAFNALGADSGAGGGALGLRNEIWSNLASHSTPSLWLVTARPTKTSAGNVRVTVPAIFQFTPSLE